MTGAEDNGEDRIRGQRTGIQGRQEEKATGEDEGVFLQDQVRVYLMLAVSFVIFYK